MAKNVAHASKGKSLSSGEANENERRGWSEESYRRKNENRFNNYDWSRHRLNFEIKDGKILPLGSQEISLYDRYHNLLKALDYKQYKVGASNQPHTYVELIMSGGTEKMQKIAFGNQDVNYERNPERWKNWEVSRTKDIEEWALDVYHFVCNKYGKENIIGFEVHLDETEPHAHVNIVPTAIKQIAGRSGGYHKIMMKDGLPVLDDEDKTIPARYTKGKHIGEIIKISDSKYDTLSSEKMREYQKNERRTIKTVSFAEHFGSTKIERSTMMSKLHDEYFEEVGKKWGFERGDVWASLPDEEKRRRRHRTKEEAGLEREAKEAREKAEIEKRHVINEKNDAVRELEETKAETVRNEKIIDNQATVIGHNKNNIEAQQKTKLELQKSIDLMSNINNLGDRHIEKYVQDLESIKITLNKEFIKKLISPLKNHPRIEYTNPPLSVRELEDIARNEEEKIVNQIISFGFSGISKDKAKKIIRDIRTDVQTILFDVVSAKQKDGIIKANKEWYQDVQRQMADNYKKVDKYDAMKKEGVSEPSQVKELKEVAERTEAAEDMMEFAWPGVRKAKEILTDPMLDEHYMNQEQRKHISNILRKSPKDRLADIEKLINYAGNFREISPATKAEAIMLAAEKCIKSVMEKGYDIMAEATKGAETTATDLGYEVDELANITATTAVCLIYGYFDAATTVSQSCGGGGDGSNNDFPKKKDDEDWRAFCGRCLGASISMMRSNSKKKHQSEGYHR